MINNYELLILNYIFNAMHDFNSPYSINIGLALINLRQNRKVPIKEAGWELGGAQSCLLVPLAGGPRSQLKGICKSSPGTQAGPCQEEWEMDVNPWCISGGRWNRENGDRSLPQPEEPEPSTARGALHGSYVVPSVCVKRKLDCSA